MSDGCENCNAEDQEDHRYHRVQWGDHPRHRTLPSTWRNPVAWNAKAAAAIEQRRVFANSLSDFWDNQVDPAMRAEAWAVMRQCPHLDWLILTKRPQNIRKMLPPDWGRGWPNVWLGTTVENMLEARRRLPLLLRIPAVCHFGSCEPMLEPLDLRPWLGEGPNRLNWVICGGESGRNRRMMDPEWARGLRDQCAVKGVAFFMKQMTALRPKEGVRLIPPDLRIFQSPDLNE